MAKDTHTFDEQPLAVAAATDQRRSSDVSPLSIAELDENFCQHQSPTYWNWLKQFESTPTATIQHHPDFLLHDLRAHRELRDRPGFYLSASESAGSSWAAGIVPKTVTLRRSAGLGWQRQVQGYRLVGSGHLGQGSEASLQSFQRQLEEFVLQKNVNFLLLEDVLQPSCTWDLLTSRPDPIFRLDFLTEFSSRFRIRLPKNADEYWRGFSKNARKQNRRILEANQRFTLWRATEVNQVAELLAAAKQVSERSWQSDRLQVRLCQDESRLELLTFLAQQRALRSYVLFDGNTPIAFELDHQFNGYLVSEDAAYDQRYAEHSPGRTLLLRVLEDLFAQDSPAWYDFAAGDWDYKRRFSNDVVQSAKVWMVKRNIRFKTISTLLRAERTLRSAGRWFREYVRSKRSTPKPQSPEA